MVKLMLPSGRSSAGFLMKVAPPTRVVYTTVPSARLALSEL